MDMGAFLSGNPWRTFPQELLIVALKPPSTYDKASLTTKMMVNVLNIFSEILDNYPPLTSFKGYCIRCHHTPPDL